MQGSKKVSVKLGMLDTASIVLRTLAKEKLPFKASYWLRRDIDAITKIYQPFFEAKQELFKQFAELDERGNVKLDPSGRSVLLIEEKKEEFFKQYNELATKDVEVEVFPLEIDWFDNVEISIEELVTIDFLLREEIKDVKEVS